MLKKNIYFIAFGAFAVFIFLIGFLVIPKLIITPEIKNTADKQEDTKTVNTSSKQLTASSTAFLTEIEKNSPLRLSIQKGDTSDCSSIKEDDVKNQCIMLAAEYLRDKDLCLTIKDKKTTQNCVDRATYKKALSDNQISLCLDIQDSNLNQSCIIKLVSSREDVKNSDCDALPEKEKKYCSDYLVSASDYLTYQNAAKVNDCQKIVNPGIKDFCTDKFEK
ncbi:MAG: hypothetical protein WC415_03940 [Patescibacteria group bacterium]|jgi:hypothetical protein